MGDLTGLDLSTKSVCVLQSTVPTLLQRLLLLILLRLCPLHVWTRPRGLLQLGVTFYHLQACLNIGTWCGVLSAAIGCNGGVLIRIL